MHEDIVVAADYSRILANALNLKPEQLPALLEGTSFTPQQFMALEGYITWSDQHRIIDNALQLANTPGLGLIAGKRYSLATHGLLGVATMSCPTVLESLKTLICYQPTRAQFNQLRLEEAGEQILLPLELRVPLDSVGTFLLEALLVSTTSTLASLIGDEVRNVDIDLAFPKPAYSKLFNDYLPGRIHFDQPCTQIRFPRAYGQLTIPTHDAQTRRWAIEQCEQQFQRLRHLKSFTERATTLLRQSPGDPLQQDQMARLLNVSTRTLLRRLKEEGTTYKQLVDDEQKRLAQHYLDNTQLTIETIAEIVGYHDISSFRRAFKRWFDMPPSQYTRKVQNKGE